MAAINEISSWFCSVTLFVPGGIDKGIQMLKFTFLWIDFTLTPTPFLFNHILYHLDKYGLLNVNCNEYDFLNIER